MQQRWFGPYLIGEEIARGGQGAVYLAKHSQLGSIVAIKIMLEPDDRYGLKRFQQEAKVLARLSHPNILKVIDLGIQDGFPYIAMEYIEGMSFKQMLGHGYDPQQAVRDLITIAEALDYCHEQGISHRDLKPDNIVIEKNSGRPVLIDFGLVKRDSSKMKLETLDRSRLSLTGEVKGTPAYMAPEQLDSDLGDEGPASDVYALGGILFYILTGRTAFQGAAHYNLMVKILRDEAPDPREINPEISPPFAELCNTALSKDPHDRPASAQIFADALKIALNPPRRKRHKRRRRYWPAAMVAGGLLAAGIGYTAAYRDHHATPVRVSKTPNIGVIPTPKRLPARVSPSPEIASSPEILAVKDLDTIITEINTAYTAGDGATMLLKSNDMIKNYPTFYRGYLYRATAYMTLYKTETSNRERVKYKQQVIADIDRAIELCSNSDEKVKLRQLKSTVLKEM